MTKNHKSKVTGDKQAPGIALSAILRAMGLRSISGLCICLSITACNAQQPPAVSAVTPAPSEGAPLGKAVGLTIYGYNYTNRYIDQFYVNGNGGENLRVSGPSSGGGGSVCCFSYTLGTPAPKTVTVRWQHEACMYKITTSTNYTTSRTHPFFKILEVPVNPHVPANPGYFEVHFYPDGHVEAAITEYSSPPRLLLSKDREDRSDYPRCPHDKKPQE